MRNSALATNDYSDEHKNKSWETSSGHLVQTMPDLTYGWGPVSYVSPSSSWAPRLFTHQTAKVVMPTLKVPQWLNDVLERTNNLLRLQPNWDSYGAKPIDIQSAVTSLQILASAALAENAGAPQIVPTPQGGVQLEWHGANSDLELCVELPLISVFYENTDDPTKNDHRVVNVPEAIEAVKSLTKDFD